MSKRLKHLRIGNSLGVDHWSLNISPKGFTLIELLIVIAIIIILSVAALVVYRDLAAQARDATRVTDLANIVDAVQLATHDAVDPALALCTGTTAPCSGTTYPVSGSTQNTNGTGWVLVNFDLRNVASFNQLPLDPTNNATYHYIYASDGQNWKITVPFESQKYHDRMAHDGGTDANLYEVGVGIRNLP